MQAKQAIRGRPRSRLPLAREGWPFIVPMAALLLFCAVMSWHVATVVVGILLILTVNFFRDPDRIVPDDPCAFIAPADGKVIRCESVEGIHHVDIFMNVFNVHVNRAPMAGRVTHMHYFPGAFLNASFEKASEQNERNSFTLLGDDKTMIVFTQIAGLIARRIVSYVAVGDQVKAGQRIGMIRFGSRVDCRIPEDYEVAVAVGDKVKAGESVLARKKHHG